VVLPPGNLLDALDADQRVIGHEARRLARPGDDGPQDAEVLVVRPRGDLVILDELGLRGLPGADKLGRRRSPKPGRMCLFAIIVNTAAELAFIAPCITRVSRWPIHRSMTVPKGSGVTSW